LKPLERVRRTFSYKEVDRPPIDIGSTPNTGINVAACENISKYLGYAEPVKVLSDQWQIAALDEGVLQKLHADVRGVFAPTPAEYQNRFISDKRFVDEWGLVYECPTGSLYYDLVHHPLAELDRDQLAGYPWPDPSHPGRLAGVREAAKALRDEEMYAVAGTPSGGTSLFERAWYLRGMEQLLVDMVIDKPFVHLLFEILTDLQIRRWKSFLHETGPYLDVVCIGDDLAGQESTIMSPELYRELIKPYQSRYFSIIKQLTDAKLFYHSCGNVTPILDDLIDIGVDIINPVQVSAKDMDPSALKKSFGEKVVFWGAIDTCDLLNNGTSSQVAEETSRIIALLGEGGGYVVAANHNIQADVPPANIMAMIRAASATSDI